MLLACCISMLYAWYLLEAHVLSAVLYEKLHWGEISDTNSASIY